MSDKKWPKCQTTAPERVRLLGLHDEEDMPFEAERLKEWDEHPASTGDAQYTRTDIAEARIAELEARIAQLEESAIGGYEDGWHALRNERDALRARIEDAPVVHDVTGKLGFVGRDVALVRLGDDE